MNRSFRNKINKHFTALEGLLHQLICKATLKLSLSEREDDGDSTSESEVEVEEMKRRVKVLRKRRKKKKLNKTRPKSRGPREHSDSEIQYNKSNKLSVFDLIPPTQVSCQTKTVRTTTTKVLTEKRSEITIQLAEVQAKLYTLKNKLWFGTGNGDGPISWGCSQFCFSTSRSTSPQKTNGSKPARKKSAKKSEKNAKNKNNIKPKIESREKSGQTQTGLRRQTACEWAPTKIRKSKSLPDHLTLLEKTKQLSIVDDNFRPEKLNKSVTKPEPEKTKKKKKRTKFLKKAKVVSNAKTFVT